MDSKYKTYHPGLIKWTDEAIAIDDIFYCNEASMPEDYFRIFKFNGAEWWIFDEIVKCAQCWAVITDNNWGCLYPDMSTNRYEFKCRTCEPNAVEHMWTRFRFNHIEKIDGYDEAVKIMKDLDSETRTLWQEINDNPILLERLNQVSLYSPLNPLVKDS